MAAKKHPTQQQVSNTEVPADANRNISTTSNAATSSNGLAGYVKFRSYWWFYREVKIVISLEEGNLQLLKN